jgi:hypothetical protein
MPFSFMDLLNKDGCRARRLTCQRILIFPIRNVAVSTEDAWLSLRDAIFHSSAGVQHFSFKLKSVCS